MGRSRRARTDGCCAAELRRVLENGGDEQVFVLKYQNLFTHSDNSSLLPTCCLGIGRTPNQALLRLDFRHHSWARASLWNRRRSPSITAYPFCKEHCQQRCCPRCLCHWVEEARVEQPTFCGWRWAKRKFAQGENPSRFGDTIAFCYPHHTAD